MTEDDMALLERRYALETEAAAIRLTLAKRHLFDDKWRVYSEYRWYRKMPDATWAFNINSDTVQFGKRGGMVRNGFEWLLIARNDGRLDGAAPVPTVGIKQFKPGYKVADLTGVYKSAHFRIPPPQDWLAARYGWDEDLKALFHVEAGRLVYILPGEFVWLEDDKLYATWRVKSMLLFGNPDGFADAEQHKEILASAPKLETGLGKALTELGAQSDPHARAKEHEAKAAELEKNNRPVYPQRTDAENKKRVEQIRLEMAARKAARKQKER